VSTFLHGLWKQGALQGVTPEDAFAVQCGLGTTMTPEDVRDGRLVVDVRVALLHPAEFIELTFRQGVARS
jgi:phage tail sheath protein FI